MVATNKQTGAEIKKVAKPERDRPHNDLILAPRAGRLEYLRSILSKE